MPQTHSSYVTLLRDIIDADPSSYEEVAKNGIVEEKVYVEHPLGVEKHNIHTHVCKLKKALYNTYSYMRNLKIT